MFKPVSFPGYRFSKEKSMAFMALKLGNVRAHLLLCWHLLD